MTMQTITIITHWFGGPLPAWYRLFLRTCEWNPTIRWLVVTDCDVPYKLTENIKIVSMTLNELTKRATTQTGYEFKAQSGYRVGDWRPAFGEIFEDLLHDADFWGHCDPDVFFGNMREFLTEDILQAYDIISADTRMLCGAFTLYRNDHSINQIYRGVPDFQQVLDGKFSPGFDELGMDRHLRKTDVCRVLRTALCSYSEVCSSVRCDATGLYLEGSRPAMAYHFRAVKDHLVMRCPDSAVSWVLQLNEIIESGAKA